MTEENVTERSPLARPQFIIAGAVVGLIALAGIIVGVTAANNDDPAPIATPSDTGPTASPSVSATPDADASVCGLAGVEMTGRLATPPEATWEYQDVYALPVSPTAGPGAAAPEGYRYCFQRTPAGALFAAANAAATGSVDDPVLLGAWLDYVLAPGQKRAELLADLGEGQSPSDDARGAIAGFRILSYDGATARVDIAFTVAAGGQTVTLSAVYELVWIDGDWKISTDVEEPLRVAQIPNTAGYVGWREA